MNSFLILAAPSRRIHGEGDVDTRQPRRLIVSPTFALAGDKWKLFCPFMEATWA